MKRRTNVVLDMDSVAQAGRGTGEKTCSGAITKRCRRSCAGTSSVRPSTRCMTTSKPGQARDCVEACWPEVAADLWPTQQRIADKGRAAVILLDSSAWSHSQEKRLQFDSRVGGDDVAVCPPVVQELLQGSGAEARYRRIRARHAGALHHIRAGRSRLGSLTARPSASPTAHDHPFFSRSTLPITSL